MIRGAYYNEFDRGAAAWLRELIKAGEIAPGDVDERSIVDVKPGDLKNYAQCHFFAGIGGWSRALRVAGIPDSKRIWSGSPPCQPLSGAGQRKGHADERHLWPAFFDLIAECRPSTVVGEQVASADGREWFAGVRADLEGVGYACGAADLCSAGIGAPNIRQRIYWVADALRIGREDANVDEQGGFKKSGIGEAKDARNDREPCGLADTDGGNTGSKREQRSGEHGQQSQNDGALRVADTDRDRFAQGSGIERGEEEKRIQHGNDVERCGASSGLGNSDEPRSQGRGCGGVGGRELPSRAPVLPRSGFWDRFDVIYCTDGKARRVEPGTFPLAHGVSGRVGLLRGYGNAINPELAAIFIRAALNL